MKKNPRMGLRSQAVKEVIKGRDDRAELFTKDSQINKDVKERYHELLKENALPVKKVAKHPHARLKLSKSKSKSKKRPRSSARKSRTRKGASFTRGW